MLTPDRVLGTSWSYHRVQNHYTYNARFEILEVEPNGKLGIYVYSRDTGLDFSELDELDLDSLEDLVQRKWIRELTEVQDQTAGGENSWLTSVVYYAAIILWMFGAITFYAGIFHHHTNLKMAETAIGAAMMIGAVVAVAIRRS